VGGSLSVHWEVAPRMREQSVISLLPTGAQCRTTAPCAPGCYAQAMPPAPCLSLGQGRPFPWV
jgi:hypothetical protein